MEVKKLDVSAIAVSTFFGRNAAATLCLCLLASVFLYGFVLIVHLLAPLIFVVLLIGSWVHFLAIRKAKSKSERVFLDIVCALCTSLLLTSVGGPGWNIVQNGYENTNVRGSTDWALLYGFLLAPVMFAMLKFINHGAFDRLQLESELQSKHRQQ